jgi:XRE family aerobic/anaerobic benzoate catabolism transcriptional regulator
MAATRNDVLHDLGRAVRARRMERGLTLHGLSEAAGVSPRFLASIEAGDGNISVARLCDVASALGTTAAALLEGVGEPHGCLVALVGLRGAGKSTIGPKLAQRLGLPFLELDQIIEQSAGERLSELFELHGESFYRRLEREALRDLVRQSKSAVLATGGSIVSDAETWELLRRTSTTVWLKARPEDHMNRVLAQGDERPMKNRSDAMNELRTLLKTRAALYAQSDHVVDTSMLGVEGAVDVLVATLGPIVHRA